MTKITRELQDVLKKNPLIEAVYFTHEGDHYLNKHKTTIHKTNDANQSIGIEEVECVQANQSIIFIPKKVNGGIQWVAARRNTSYKAIEKVLNREEVLKAQPVASAMSEREKLDVLTKAAEIARGDDFESLMKKLKTK